MTKWQLQEAKARFSELIDNTLEKGPQVVTRRGIDTAVVVSIDEWRKLKDENRLTWKDVLLGERSAIRNPAPHTWHGQIAQACGVRLIRCLIDANVVPELRKPKPHGAAVVWLQSLELGQGFFGGNVRGNSKACGTHAPAGSF
jgi:antitoxin Phd